MSLELDELKYRRYFKWATFLAENNTFVFDKEEIVYVKELIEKGYRCQEILEKGMNDFQSYEQYAKAILLYTSLQDDIMNKITDFKEQIIKYREQHNKKNIKKGYRWCNF